MSGCYQSERETRRPPSPALVQLGITRAILDRCLLTLRIHAEWRWEAAVSQPETTESEETPIDVPLHSGVEKFLRDNKL